MTGGSLDSSGAKKRLTGCHWDAGISRMTKKHYVPDVPEPFPVLRFPRSIKYSLSIVRIEKDSEPSDLECLAPCINYELSQKPFGNFAVGDILFKAPFGIFGTIKHIGHYIAKYDKVTLLHGTRLYVVAETNTRKGKFTSN